MIYHSEWRWKRVCSTLTVQWIVIDDYLYVVHRVTPCCLEGVVQTSVYVGAVCVLCMLYTGHSVMFYPASYRVLCIPYTLLRMLCTWSFCVLGMMFTGPSCVFCACCNREIIQSSVYVVHSIILRSRPVVTGSYSMMYVLAGIVFCPV